MSLEAFRETILEIDTEILYLLKRRMELLPAIVKYKQIHGLPTEDKDREKVLLKNHVKIAQKEGLNPAFIEETFKIILLESKRVQDAMNRKN